MIAAPCALFHGSNLANTALPRRSRTVQIGVNVGRIRENARKPHRAAIEHFYQSGGGDAIHASLRCLASVTSAAVSGPIGSRCG